MLERIFNATEERIIYFALLGSCLVHALALGVSYFLMPQTVKDRVKAIEIVYHVKSRPKAEIKQAQIQSVASVKGPQKASVEPLSRSMREKQLLGAALFRDTIAPATRIDVSDKQLIKMANMVEKRSITVPALNAQKITNPQYLSYNDRIRDKIRNRAYFYIDDPKFQAGEVYMTFVVTSDGALKDLQVINDRSHANDYLRTVGLRSIKESSPFPPFPSELKYPELSFNVVISFEVSKK